MDIFVGKLVKGDEELGNCLVIAVQSLKIPVLYRTLSR